MTKTEFITTSNVYYDNELLVNKISEMTVSEILNSPTKPSITLWPP